MYIRRLNPVSSKLRLSFFQFTLSRRVGKLRYTGCTKFAPGVMKGGKLSFYLWLRKVNKVFIFSCHGISRGVESVRSKCSVLIPQQVPSSLFSLSSTRFTSVFLAFSLPFPSLYTDVTLIWPQKQKKRSNLPQQNMRSTKMTKYLL